MSPFISRSLLVGRISYSRPSYLPALSRAASPSSGQQASHLIHSQSPGDTQPRRSVLEVERKFAPTATSIRQLDHNTGQPPFESVVHKGITCFEDTYYDTPEDTLSKAGVWIRRREKLQCGARRFAGTRRAGPPHSASWEAKVRMGGDFINSAFKEVTGAQEISALLGTLVPGSGLDADHRPRGGGVREMASFVTDRTGYLVDGMFTVVIDVTDFGHTVGEVELEQDVTEASCDDMAKSVTIAAMDEDIEAFMKRFLWAFPVGKPVGKLTAYFKRGADGRLDEQL